MPYLPVADRKPFDDKMKDLVLTKPGELAYCMTVLIRSYLTTRGLSFENLAAVLGVITATEDEFYRRVVAGYETGKAADNGDVVWY